MEEKISNFVDALFASQEQSQAVEELKSETAARLIVEYYRLRGEGKSEDEAYALAIASVGDVSLLFERASQREVAHEGEKSLARHSVMTAVGVMLCVLSVVPVIGLQNEVGVILMLVMIAAAVGLFVFSSMMKKKNVVDIPAERSNPVKKAVSSLLWAFVAAFYFIISFSTGAWYITWLLFPIGGALEGVVSAVFDLTGGKV